MLVAALLGMGVTIGCGGNPPSASIAAPGASDQKPGATDSADNPAGAQEVSGSAVGPDSGSKTVQIVVEMDAGNVVVELYPDKAPDTVHNFLTYYVYRNHYDNSLIHYVTEQMLIGGGYDAEQKPTPSFGPIRNESDNGLSNDRGTIAMSRHPEFPDSAISQFFFNLQDNHGLNHQPAEDGVSVGGNGYCVFGRVVKGLDVLDKLSKTPTEDTEMFSKFPTQPLIVRTIRRASN